MYKFKKMSKNLSLLLTVIMIFTFFIPAINANGAEQFPSQVEVSMAVVGEEQEGDDPEEDEFYHFDSNCASCHSGYDVEIVGNAVEFLHQEYLAKGLVNKEYEGVGSYALYILNQAGVDVSGWEYEGEKFEESVISAVYDDIKKESSDKPVNAKMLARDAAAAQVLEESDYLNQLVQILQDRQTEDGFGGSMYSDIPAFDLLGRIGLINEINTEQAKTYILGLMEQTVVGNAYSWGFRFGDPAVYYADFITTTNAVRALNYLDPDKNDPEIQNVITHALDWMKKQQQADGSFVAGYSAMADPLKYTAEVIGTLKALNIDPYAWKSSENKSAVDYLINNGINADGSFGKSGDAMDAVWFLYAYNFMDTVFYLYPACGIMDIGDQKQLKAMLKGKDGIFDVTADVEWSVADGSIIGANHGLATALKAGQTIVQAVYNDSTASAVLKVNSPDPGSGKGDVLSKIKVSMAVVGKNGALLFAPSSFSVNSTNEWGLSVLGALDASGADYRIGLWEEWGYYIDSVQGLDSNGTGGWMYAVNNKAGMTMAANCTIKNNDKIVFYWASAMEDQPPLWSDLLKLKDIDSGNTQIKAEDISSISDTELNKSLQNADSAGQVVLQTDETKNVLAISKGQLTKIEDIGKPLAVAIQGMQFVLSPEFLKLSEITANNSSQLLMKAEKMSDWEIQNQLPPFTGKLKLAGDVYELDLLIAKENGTQEKIQQMSVCTIVLPVQEGFVEAAKNGTIMAYYYNETDKAWEYVGGIYDEKSNTVSFKAKHFSKYALLNVTGSFDDIYGHWAQEEIEFMAANGFVNGVGDDKFFPAAQVTRAEFVAILTRMAGLTVKSDAVKEFSDMSSDAWYRNAIDVAVSNGIVNGIDQNCFNPKGLITREQMVTMIERLMAEKGINTRINDVDAKGVLDKFSDKAAISSWAQNPVAFTVQEELMKGRENGRFVPQGNTTRAEAAVVLFRVLQKLL